LNTIIQLLNFLLLTDFPSGSAINLHNEKLYLVGDDATQVLVVDKEYRKVDSIRLADYTGKRIPKTEKADFESAAFIDINGDATLLVLGSAATEERKKMVVITFSEDKSTTSKGYKLDEFMNRLSDEGVDLNIEGMTKVGNNLILANRGNIAYPQNSIIIASENFRDNQQAATIKICNLNITSDSAAFIGISDLHYVASSDVLLFSFSSEETTNSYDDGKIGDSYIGWIWNLSSKTDLTEWKLDGLINLTTVDPEFKNEKIEGLCVESVKDNVYVLHLISDNDDGFSKLFKIKMELRD
jgi:hypothetical protein